MSADEERGDAGGAPDTSTQGVDPDVESDAGGDSATMKQESSVGPGAGNNPVVKTTAPVQHEDDEVTHHPSLREPNER